MDIVLVLGTNPGASGSVRQSSSRYFQVPFNVLDWPELRGEGLWGGTASRGRLAMGQAALFWDVMQISHGLRDNGNAS